MAIDCRSLLERLEKGADEKAISRALRAAETLMRCQPGHRASECSRVAEWLSAKAIDSLGECPCWEPIPPHTLSLTMYLLTHSVMFYLRAKAEASRANLRWQPLHDPEFRLQHLLPWALHESRLFGMPALRVRLLRCICEGFARTPNVNMHKSKCGAEAHLMLADLIFQGTTDLSIGEGLDAGTDMNMGMQLSSQPELSSDIICAAGSSNIKGTDLDVKLSVCVNAVGIDGSSTSEHMDDVIIVDENLDMKRASSINVTSVFADIDGSSKTQGMASSHAKDLDANRKKGMDMEVKKALDSYPREENSDMKRASELVECLCMLDMAKELVPSNERSLKRRISVLRISVLRVQIKLATFSVYPKLWKIKLPSFVSKSSGGGDSGSTLANYIAPLLKVKHLLFLSHIVYTMSLLIYNESTKKQ